MTALLSHDPRAACACGLLAGSPPGPVVGQGPKSPGKGNKSGLARQRAPDGPFAGEAHGDPDSIAAAVGAHRAAGADHVILMPSGAPGTDLATGVSQLERLAPAVLGVP